MSNNHRKLTALSLTFLAATLCSGLVACGPDGNDCVASWWSANPDTDASAELLGDVSYSYGLDDSDRATAKCLDEQASDPARPDNVGYFECDCQTN